MREPNMFRSAKNTTKRTEDVKKSAAKVLDTKKDTATRAKVNTLFYTSIGKFLITWTPVQYRQFCVCLIGEV
jgi:hypothetical protein